MLHAKVRGLPIAYQRAGRGAPLLLLHGFLADSRMWRPQLESLSSEFTVIAWDAPGAGQSADPPEPFGIDDWADCLAGLLDVVGVESAHVVGLSWGGMLAQEFYRRRRERVRSLTLAGTYAGWRRSLGEASLRRAAGELSSRRFAPGRGGRRQVHAGDARRVGDAGRPRRAGTHHVRLPPCGIPADGQERSDSRALGACPSHALSNEPSIAASVGDIGASSPRDRSPSEIDASAGASPQRECRSRSRRP